jgi:5-methylcytosine-specific restriction endonuclease McrA
MSVHIVLSGTANGDLEWLIKTARSNKNRGVWVVPKDAAIDDTIVIYLHGMGFIATATVTSETERREDWNNKYGASIEDITLIEPPISLAVIRQRIPTLLWANYPRGPHSLSPAHTKKVQELITERETIGVIPTSEKQLDELNRLELREIAIGASDKSTPSVIRKKREYYRAPAVRKYVMLRAEGLCEHCGENAPFVTESDEPYLEAHHINRLADGGADHPREVIALCPNCHRRAHHSKDKEGFRVILLKKAEKLEND